MAAPGIRSDIPERGEDTAIDAIVRLATEAVRRGTPPGGLARRDAHPKHHAIVRAEFTVREDVPPDLRHGVFAHPRTYPAWIRFSNGAPHPQPDTKRDQRGMAIKLLDVPGRKVLDAEREAPTQDFVLASCPRFFIRRLEDYVAFTRAATRPPAIRALGYFIGPVPWRWRLYELRALVQSLQPADDLLRLRYYSQTAYACGPVVVKYGTRPLAPPPPPGRGRGDGFLRERLARWLSARPAAFEFLIQRQGDPARMPIEDATVEWDEREAPFVPVATIDIPAQTFESPAQMALAEQISYTPWHTLPEHVPLGSVNQVRRAVYDAVSKTRHELNDVPRREPTSLALEDSGVDRAARRGSEGDAR
jgi:hypothetical protein